MLALSIRQPYAELILRGIKTIEFRSRPTKVIGQRFYIYASQKWATGKLLMEGCQRAEKDDKVTRRQGDKVKEALTVSPSHLVTPSSVLWSTDLAMPGVLEPWMRELAEMLILKDLPTGVIVGSAIIEKVSEGNEMYQWHLTEVERFKQHRKPKRHPQPVWFSPF